MARCGSLHSRVGALVAENPAGTVLPRWGIRVALATVLVLQWAACVASGATYTTMVNSGSSSNRVNMVFIGDGYTSAQISAGTYRNHVNAMISHMFSSATQDPFPRYRNFFNVYRIDQASNQSGADDPSKGIYVDTALDASYYWDGVTDRLLYINETKANNIVNATLAGTGITPNMRIVPVNSTTYGGGGGTYYGAYAAGNSWGTEVEMHELGHSFGHLADEYVDTAYYGVTYTGPEFTQANATIDNNPATTKWSQWIGYVDPAHTGMGAIGLYQGAGWQYAAYRPTADSKMRTLGQPFNAVSREALILQIYENVRPIDSWLANTDPLVGINNFWIDVVDPNVIKVKWYVDNQLVTGAVGEAFRLSDYGYLGDHYSVRALAYDDTIGNWVRSDTDLLQMSIDWTVVPEPATLTMLALGALAMMRRRRSIRNRV